MTYRHFRIFKEVCMHESMTKAANALFMTQPSVTQAIKEMEGYYGIMLFSRVSRRIYMTKQAEMMLEHVNQILMLQEDLEDAFKGSVNAHVPLKIGATITIGNTFFCDLVSRFSLQNRNYDITTYVNNIQKISDMLASNDIDIAIIASTHADALDFKHISFYEDKLVVICSKQYFDYDKPSIDVSALAKLPLFVREKGSDIRKLLENKCENLNIKGEYSSSQAMFHAVRQGMGVAVLPKAFFDPNENKQLYSIDIENNEFVQKYQLVVSQNKQDQISIKDFIAFCLKYKKILDYNS
jgi:DNA-binding transcriptional LysR family regulator